MEYVTLNNGVEVPKLGFGVYQIPQDSCERCVLNAIEVGFRHIDTAQSYLNEAEVGNAISHCGIDRKDLFITTKVWIEFYGYEQTKVSIQKSLEKLKVDYIDLVLLHQPFGDYYSAYHALEDLYSQGILRAIGVSNFYPDRLADLAAFNKIVPQVNQVEVNPLFQQKEAQESMTKLHIQMAAWSPFGHGSSDIFHHPMLLKLATQHHKSAAQVVLRWLMQRDIITLVKSTHMERMKENFDIFDFTLMQKDLEEISALDTNTSLFFDHRTPDAVDRFVSLIREKRGKI